MTIYVKCFLFHDKELLNHNAIGHIFLLHYGSVVPYRGRGNISQILAVAQRELFIYSQHIQSDI